MKKRGKSMTREEEIVSRRLLELGETAYRKGRYTFTDFLGLSEYDIFLSLAREMSYIPYTVWGGAAGCERVMVRFGDEETLGYPAPPFPLICLSVCPVAPQFAEPLAHRDILGAVLHLGVRRECVGDIVRKEDAMYLFCAEKIAPFLAENLAKVRATPVKVTPTCAPLTVEQMLAPETIQVAAPRVDAVIAHLYHISRTESAALFFAHRVYIGGRLCEDPARLLRTGDIVTVRGQGRFRYGEEHGLSRKGKRCVTVEKFV